MNLLPRRSRVRWNQAYRIISTRYPPIGLFERVADPKDWEDLIELESLSNPRIRNEVGDIQLVPPEERVSGPGAGWLMASFTHIGHPSRFSDGTFGVCYLARSRAAAIAETAFHWGNFYAATHESRCEVDMRVLTGRVSGELDDLRGGLPRYKPLLDPDRYSASQAFARDRLRGKSSGIVYESVRLSGHDCVAAFRPRVVHITSGARFLLYQFDGEQISQYFDYEKSAWLPVPSPN